MLIFDKVHLVGDLFSTLNCLVIGYSLGKIVTYRKCMKDIRELQETTDREMAQWIRMVDFQLRAKGCEGLTPHEGEGQAQEEKTV